MRSKKKPPRGHGDDLRGASRLVIDATKRVTDVVEGMHRTIASGPAILGEPLALPARMITGLVYGSIRGVTHVVGAGIDAALEQLSPLLGSSTPGPERAAVLSALNGVIGDYLVETGNPLAIEMRLCHAGAPLVLERPSLAASFPEAKGKLLVLAHGSSMNDLQWSRGGHDHGAALATDLGFTPVYLRYNTGLHISTNGLAFAERLEELVGAWPVPVQELVILGHSMGGLVARSAVHCAEVRGDTWRKTLTALFFLGSPHHGAPYERAGNQAERLLGISRYTAPLQALGRLRSAGVTDLRYGNVLDEDWVGRDRFAPGKDPRTRLPLPVAVRCHAIAGTLTASPGANEKKLRGDGLVPVASALGLHDERERSLGIAADHRWVAYGTGHLDLLWARPVYETLRMWLSP